MFQRYVLKLGASLFVLTLGRIVTPQLNPASAAPISASEPPFTVGEELKYEASWANFVLAGDMKLQVKERRVFHGIEGYHLLLQAQSVGIVRALLYDLNEVYESYVSAGTLLPFHAENYWEHGSQRERISVKFDQNRGTARLTGSSPFKIPPQTHDLVSLLHAIRRMDLAPGAARTFSLLENKELYTVRAEPEATDRISLRTATYETVRIALRQVEAGRIKDPYKLRLYLSRDLRRLPVLVTAEPNWGRIRVELTSVTGISPHRKPLL